MTAPLVANVRSADSRNASVAKRVSLWFLAAGLSGEANWREFGTVIDGQLTPGVTYLEHYTNRRGAKTRDRIEISEIKSDFQFKLDEVNVINLQKIFGSSVAKVSGTPVVRDSQIFANPGNAGTIQLPAGNLSTVILRSTGEEGTPTVYTVSTDYTVDLTTGIVTIANTPGALYDPVAVPEVEIQWAKTLNSETFQIFDGTPLRGSAQLQILTKNGLRMIATFNSVVITNQGAITIGDGSKWIECGIKMECLADASGSLGNVHVIDATETF